MKYAFILGRTPDLSIAELGIFFGTALTWTKNKTLAFVDDALPGEPQEFLNRLGGTTEILEIFAADVSPPTLESAIFAYLKMRGAKLHGKLNFALNLIPEVTHSRVLKHLLPKLKKTLRAEGFKANFMNKNFRNVSSVFAAKERLTEHGTNISIIELGEGKLALGFGVAMQDFEGYSKRDFNKPFRDAAVGMIPPKLAQMIINVAVGGRPDAVIASEAKQSGAKAPSRAGGEGSTRLLGCARNDTIILDPFCGSGTILMEALLMGFSVIGADKDTRMIEGAKKNVDWLRNAFPKSVPVNTTVQFLHKDATALSAADVTHALSKGDPGDQGDPADPVILNSFQDLAIVTEPHLGPVLSQFPAENFLARVISDLSSLYLAFFKNLAAIIPPGTPVVFIFPYWKTHAERRLISGMLMPKITSLGYKATAPSLFYDRPDSIVGREIVRFVKQ